MIACETSEARKRMTSANACGVTHLEKSAWGMSARFAGVSMMDGRTRARVVIYSVMFEYSSAGESRLPLVEKGGYRFGVIARLMRQRLEGS